MAGFEAILVVGPGRCGTSVVMRLLNLAGVALADDLVPANEANPEGHWEDRIVVEAHRELLTSLGRDELIGSAMPLEAGWMQSPAAIAVKRKLAAHMEAARAANDGPFGVKDPRLSLLLPMWRELGRELKLRWRVVLCLRHPASVGNSIHSAYGLDPAIGESVWLNRVACLLDALEDDFCVVHYEDLIADPARVARDLITFIRGQAPSDDEVRRLLADGKVVRRDLNRATLEKSPASPLAGKIHAALRGISGTARVTPALREAVRQYLAVCAEHPGWQKGMDKIHSRFVAVRDFRDELQRLLDQSIAQREELRGELKHALDQREKLRVKLKQSWDRRAELRGRLNEAIARHAETSRQLRAETEERAKLDASLRRLRRREQALRRQLNAVLRSRTYRLTGHVVEARKSWLRAFALPYRTWRLLLGPGQAEHALREKLLRWSDEMRELRHERGAQRRRLAEQDRNLAGLRGKARNADNEVTSLAWTLKRMLLDEQGPRLRAEAAELDAADFPLPSGIERKGRRGRKGTVRVLYLGPVGFREGIWDTRAKYIFPDLFDELMPGAEIHMLTGAVPDFARDSLRALCERFGVHHHEVSGDPYAGSATDFWLAEGLRVAHAIRPDVVTNIFGAADIGFVIGMLGRMLGCRTALRISGDELGVRKLIGSYKGEDRRYAQDLLHQNLSFAMSDVILTMSAWEQQRVRSLLTAGDKVVICMRGIDLDRFAPKNAGGTPVRRRFLYVGRKSIEKGYDIMQKAAEIVGAKEPGIEFIFAGNFDVERKGNCDYIGFVQSENLAALYDSVDALLLPSRSEGFPQALGEALAMGKPCIVPADPFGAMFRHQTDVLLTEQTPESLADAVLRLYGDPELGARLAQSSLRIAREELDRRRWKGVYRSIILAGAPDATP